MKEFRPLPDDMSIRAVSVLKAEELGVISLEFSPQGILLFSPKDERYREDGDKHCYR